MISKADSDDEDGESDEETKEARKMPGKDDFYSAYKKVSNLPVVHCTNGRPVATACTTASAAALFVNYIFYN